jgi:hypothetical protein
VAHTRQLFREFLTRLPARSAIAVEASRNYSWLVDEMERAGHRPRLCNPLQAKRRMELTNKTDKLVGCPLQPDVAQYLASQIGDRCENAAVDDLPLQLRKQIST